MEGFEPVPGDIAGSGDLGNYRNLSDTEECGSFCLNTTGCWSYEYSKTRKWCKINSFRQPTSSQWGDNGFCEKTGDIPVINCFHPFVKQVSFFDVINVMPSANYEEP